MNFEGLKDYLRMLSDDKLIKIQEELKKVTHDEDSIIRELTNKFCNEGEGLFILQVQALIWPILEVVTERLKSHIYYRDRQLKAN